LDADHDLVVIAVMGRFAFFRLPILGFRPSPPAEVGLAKPKEKTWLSHLFFTSGENEPCLPLFGCTSIGLNSPRIGGSISPRRSALLCFRRPGAEAGLPA